MIRDFCERNRGDCDSASSQVLASQHAGVSRSHWQPLRTAVSGKTPPSARLRVTAVPAHVRPVLSASMRAAAWPSSPGCPPDSCWLGRHTASHACGLLPRGLGLPGARDVHALHSPKRRRRGCWNAREVPATVWGRSLRKHAPSDVSGRSSQVDHVERMTVEQGVPLPCRNGGLRGLSRETGPRPCPSRRRPAASWGCASLHRSLRRSSRGAHCGADLDVDLAATSSKRSTERKVSWRRRGGRFTATRTSPPSKRAFPGTKASSIDRRVHLSQSDE